MNQVVTTNIDWWIWRSYPQQGQFGHWFYTETNNCIRVISFRKASREEQRSYERVRQISDEAPIPYDPEDGPYDPNDAEATRAYLDSCKVITRARLVRPAFSEKTPAK